MTDPIALGLSPRTQASPSAEAQARVRREAAATIALRRAWHEAERVPALRLWRRWAGLALDHELRDAEATRLAGRQAWRAVERYRGGPDLEARLAATAAYSATVEWRPVVLAVGERDANGPPGEQATARRGDPALGRPLGRGQG